MTSKGVLLNFEQSKKKYIYELCKYQKKNKNTKAALNILCVPWEEIICLQFTEYVSV